MINKQTSLILLKTDTVERGNIWSVIKRFENRWFKILGMKMIQLDENILKEHYFHVADKPFFWGIVKYMTRKPIVAMAIFWNNSVENIRTMVGATNPSEALPWTIRWDFWFDFNTTVIHASDSEKNAKRELNIFFKENEIFEH